MRLNLKMTKPICQSGLIIILVLTLITSSNSQISLQKMISIAGNQGNNSYIDQVHPTDLEIDKDGNVISLGYYTGNIETPVLLRASYQTNNENRYLIKSNSAGQALWGVNLDGFSIAKDIETDAYANIFLAGQYDDGSGVAKAKAVKINPQNGVNSIEITLGGLTLSDFVVLKSLSIDLAGNIYMYGTCGTNVDIDAGSGINLASGDFLGVYDNNFNFIKQIALPKGITPVKVILDNSDNILITGSFRGSVDFNTDPLATNYLNSSVTNSFIAKYSKNGIFIWSIQLTSSGSGTESRAIASDSNGNIYLTGTISGLIGTDFDPSPSIYSMTSNGSNEDIFVAKYNSNGSLSFAFQVGSTNPEYVNGIKTDDSGDFYLSGNFGGTVDFDPSASSFNLTSTPGGAYSGNYVYLSKYNSMGQFIWASTVFGSSCNILEIDLNRSLWVQVHSQGNYMQQVTINKYAYQSSITSFSPSSGAAKCTQVTINGTNFSRIPGQNIVKFNEVPATVIASSSTSITAIVPMEVNYQDASGKISVQQFENDPLTVYSTSNFTVLPIEITVNPVNPIICTSLTSSTTLTASGASTYTWFPPTGLSSTSGSSVLASPSASTQYSVIGINANGCAGRKYLSVILDAGPINVNALTNKSICFGGEVSYYPTNNASYSIEIMPLAGVSYEVYSKFYKLKPSATTTYSVTVRTPNGCTNQASISQGTITVLPVPTVSISPALATICSGNPITFTLSGSGAINYTWTTNGTVINSSPNNTLTVTPTINGQAYQVQASNGICNGSSTALATVSLSANPPSLNSTLTPTALCSGATFSYIPNSVTTGATFAWSRAAIVGISQPASNGSGSISEVLTNTTSSPINVTYVYVTSANGCNNGASPQSVSVTVNPSTKINSQPLALQNICSGSSLTPLTVSATGAGTLTYQWYSKSTPTSTGTAISGATTNTFSPPSTAGNTYYYLIVTGSCGSVTSNDSQVTVNPTTVTVTPASASICANGSTTLTASGMGNYTWSPSSSLSSSTGATVTAYPISTTVYTVTGNLNGCTGTKNVRVNVTSASASISAPNGINACTGTVIITANAAASYLWSTGETTQSIYPFSSGVYTVTTYNGSCQSTASITIERSPQNCQIARVAMDPVTPTNQDLDEPTVSKLTTYPNPAEDRITVALPEKAIETTPIVLYDINGKVVANQSLMIGQWKTEIDVQQLNEGVYLIRVLNGDTISSAKVIVLR